MVNGDSQPSNSAVPVKSAIATPHRISPFVSKNKQPRLAPSWKSARQYSINKEATVQDYHRELAQPGIKGKNYIMIPPTGNGRIPAALVISDHLNMRKKKFGAACHVVYVTESKLQVRQLSEALHDLIPNAKVAAYTGETPAIEINNSIKCRDDISVWTAGKLLKEIKAGNFTFAYVSLMIFDECHHAIKEHPYAEVMELYLQFRSVAHKMPQIIGITASPGTGTNPDMDTKTIKDHLVQLAARMDATAGYKTITDELDQCRKTSEFGSSILTTSRDISQDSFYLKVVDEMKKLEMQLAGNCDATLEKVAKSSEQYRAKLRSGMHALERTSTDPRDDISTINVLCCYSNALSLYMDLQQKDAVREMTEHNGLPDDDAKCTLCERDMKERLKTLLSRVKRIYPEKNPDLEEVGRILYATFPKGSVSRGIIFVCTKQHAHGLCDWIRNSPNFKAIKPDVMTGVGPESEGGMNQATQDQVMKNFREGNTNLLIATSVAEKDLDLPDCNLVIRYQHVTNEGRTRFENSKCYLVTSDIMKEYKDLKNMIQNMLALRILINDLPTWEHFKTQLTKTQNDIIKDRRLRQILRRRKRRLLHKSEEVQLKCRKCRTFACYGSDVYVYCGGHHVVPDNLKEKYTSKKHPEPDSYLGHDFERIEKREKIYCSECDMEWGALFFWTEQGYIFPVIKCTSFVFELQESRPLFPSKWREVPSMKQFTDWLRDSDSSDND